MGQLSNMLLVSLIINGKSGHHVEGGPSLIDRLSAYYQQQGCEVTVYAAQHPCELSHLAQLALAVHHQHHQQGQQGLIVVVGGDGTINTVAHRLLHSHIPLGIIPAGTFNYVARALGLPLDPLEAAEVTLKGVQRDIHVGMVNQYIYLNNASIGLYPHLIEQREADKGRFGRYQTVAMLSGFAVLMRQHQKMRLKMIVDGHPEPIESPMVFFGNNQLQLTDMHLALADCAAAGKLAAVAMAEVNRLQILALIARMQLGTFEQSPQVHSFCADRISIESRSRSMKLAIDGEVVTANTPLQFKVARHALAVMTPHAVTPL